MDGARLVPYIPEPGELWAEVDGKRPSLVYYYVSLPFLEVNPSG